MSQAQSFANHCMYMASVVLESWHNAITEEGKSLSVLTASFGPAVRLHLLDAYGWQLLACNRVASVPTKPPHRAVDVPPLASGIAQSPEVTEMAMLERSGWLADLQREIPTGLTPQAESGVIAASSNVFDFDTARHCFAELESLMARVADAIEES